ncbi:MAG TPA: TetR/AcrR family transcriptional regulator, partial [Noviherbaspirillum sp.]|nr:TetR/AcrR family transcriptional regulator [Noviherbaspirillum sp.]
MDTLKKSRKEEILDAALACFTEHGVEATTIEMIRERANASVGSMYHHFGGKDRIAAALYIAALAEHHAAQKQLLDAAGDAESGVKAIVYAYVDWISANPDKARFLLYNRSAVIQGEAVEELRAQARAKRDEVLRVFAPWIEQGTMQRLPKEVFASLIVGPAHDYARLWLSGRAKTDIKAYR